MRIRTSKKGHNISLISHLNASGPRRNILADRLSFSKQQFRPQHHTGHRHPMSYPQRSETEHGSTPDQHPDRSCDHPDTDGSEHHKDHRPDVMHKTDLHPMPTHPQPITKMLKTTKGHITDRQMRPNTVLFPMRDRTNPQIMLVGSKAGFNLRQLTVLNHQITRITIVTPPRHNPLQTIPDRHPGNLLLTDPDLTIRNIQIPGIAPHEPRTPGACTTSRVHHTP